MQSSIRSLSLVILLLSLAIVLFSVAFNYQENADMRHAFSVCNSSRVNDTPSEELCGEILDYYHLDFVCKEANKSSQNTCVVERI